MMAFASYQFDYSDASADNLQNKTISPILDRMIRNLLNPHIYRKKSYLK
jgi:hypothetical protein